MRHAAHMPPELEWRAAALHSFYEGFGVGTRETTQQAIVSAV